MLRQISATAEHPRWKEFVSAYRPMMEAYLAAHFPSLESGETVQETLVAVSRVLPAYLAREERSGSFHNYLTGILRHKAQDALAAARRRDRLRERLEREPLPAGEEPGIPEEPPDDEWRKTVVDVAIGELLASPDVPARSRRIFERVVLDGEKPQDVADSLLMKRNTVDQVKRRMVARLGRIVERLRDADGR